MTGPVGPLRAARVTEHPAALEGSSACHTASANGAPRHESGKGDPSGSITYAKAVRWAGKGGLAILDQGLFAGANFVVNILLARWLTPEDYGAFAVAYAAFLLLAAVHTALLIEPMMVLGAERYAGSFRQYLGILLYGHWILAGLISALLAVVALATGWLGSASLATALFGLAISTPFILLLWILRRAFYVYHQPGWAAAGGALYVAVVTSGIYQLYRHNYLSPLTAMLLIGVASLVCSLVLRSLLRPYPSAAHASLTLRLVAAEHWQYSRWLLANTALCQVLSQATLPVLGVYLGLGAAGVFRAYQNLLLPIFHFLTPLSSLATPLVTRRHTQDGKVTLQRLSSPLTLFAVGLTSTYSGILLIFRHAAVRHLLGPKYLSHTGLLKLWILVPLILAFGQGHRVAARVIHRTDLLFFSSALGAIAAVLGYLFLIPAYELEGAVYGRILSVAIETITLLVLVPLTRTHSSPEATTQ